MNTNVLYYGDNNLDILPRYVPDESVDLDYLDPPFNSNASYSVIFKDESGNRSDAQMLAFDDTWHSGPDAERKYLYLTNSAYHQGRVPAPVSALIGAFHAGIKPSPMLAYLVEMAVRLVELRRVLGWPWQAGLRSAPRSIRLRCYACGTNLSACRAHIWPSNLATVVVAARRDSGTRRRLPGGDGGRHRRDHHLHLLCHRRSCSATNRKDHTGRVDGNLGWHRQHVRGRGLPGPGSPRPSLSGTER